MKKLCVLIISIAVFTMAGCGKSKSELGAESSNADKFRLEVRKKMEDEEKQFQEKLNATAKTTQDAANQRSNSTGLLAEADRRADDVLLIKKFQETLLNRLKDPSSAQFRDVKLNQRRDALCGMVNSKNAFGGYTGFSGFVVTEKNAYLQTDKKDLEDLLYRGTAEQQGCI